MNIFKLKITSPEKEDFLMEVEMDNEGTYLELHNTIQLALAYDRTQMASFFQISDMGERGKEIALFEMSSEDDDNVNIVAMDVAMMREFINKETPQLIYVFDFFSDRYFNIELVGVERRRVAVDAPKITLFKGETPEQIVMDFDSLEDFDLDGVDLKSATKRDKDFDFMDEFDDDSEEGPKFENLDDYEDIL
ncbi:IS1096 element passenger TnpR family protein [Ancylomarina sp.]|uniref:IS1096 element passenger TnpR family protein n=1 Tax=Ancylomarina sp. TaxID=1970196 RepID=UPI003565B5A5